MGFNVIVKYLLRASPDPTTVAAGLHESLGRGPSALRRRPVGDDSF